MVRNYCYVHANFAAIPPVTSAYTKIVSVVLLRIHFLCYVTRQLIPMTCVEHILKVLCDKKEMSGCPRARAGRRVSNIRSSPKLIRVAICFVNLKLFHCGKRTIAFVTLPLLFPSLCISLVCCSTT
jgi:hypothetical protein